jgi:hypothetical protein
MKRVIPYTAPSGHERYEKETAREQQQRVLAHSSLPWNLIGIYGTVILKDECRVNLPDALCAQVNAMKKCPIL